MTNAFFALTSEHLNVVVVGLFRASMNVLIQSQILVAFEGLRVLFDERIHIGLFDQNIITHHFGIKFVEGFGVVVFAHAGVDPVIPVVNGAIAGCPRPRAHRSSTPLDASNGRTRPKSHRRIGL